MLSCSWADVLAHPERHRRLSEHLLETRRANRRSPGSTESVL
jgi:hypothetical protein